MITETDVRAGHLAASVASSVADFLAPGGGLGMGDALPLPVELSLRHAVLAPLGGALGGEIALFVDDAFVDALTNSEIGALDLVDALSPLLSSVVAGFGGVQLGVPQAVDARMAQNRLEAQGDAALIVLGDGAEIRAAVAVGLAGVSSVDAAPAMPAAAPRTAPRTTPAVTHTERLDLLRGVEMAATVELGRARMTINDLLSLRDGAIIELDRAAGDAADLFVNGRLLARGEIVVIDENYALRVTQIVADEPGH